MNNVSTIAERSMLLQAAQLHQTERKVKTIAHRNEQLEALVSSYESQLSPQPFKDGPITVLNTGSHDVRFIDGRGAAIVVKPGETHTIQPRRNA